jgi:RNA polymerase sigma-70 factor, ECF subfamily
MRETLPDNAHPSPMMSEAAESDVVERARHGDREAFTTLFERYNARICRYLARLVGDDELGRDLAQDAFVAAWRALPHVMGELRFGPWLYRIATNAARSHLRRTRILHWLPWGEDERSPTAAELRVAGPEASVGEAEAVRLALTQLAPRCRACLLLQVEGGFSQREIAELLGIGEKSVSAYVSRGREQFRRAHSRLLDAGGDNGEGGQAR